MDMPSLIDLMRRAADPATPSLAASRGRCAPSGILQQTNWRRAVGACLAFGGSPQRCIWRSWMSRRRKSPSSAWTAPTAVILRSARHHPPALRLERTIHDLFGLAAEGSPDPRPGLITADGACASRWEIASTPCRKRSPYRFLPAEGDGLHQIAVGPVHAGIIEPGHFRFTASGETVVRLEERLGYAHKGIEGLMMGADLERAAQLAGRVSGDSTVAYAFAFSRAVEAALEIVVPDRAIWLRALLAELERLANHLGDIGAICNDASFALMHALCSVLRENVLRASDAAFGHRLMRDIIVPGGVTPRPQR